IRKRAGTATPDGDRRRAGDGGEALAREERLAGEPVPGRERGPVGRARAGLAADEIAVADHNRPAGEPRGEVVRGRGVAADGWGLGAGEAVGEAEVERQADERVGAEALRGVDDVTVIGASSDGADRAVLIADAGRASVVHGHERVRAGPWAG